MADDLIQIVRQQIPTTIWPSATPQPASMPSDDPANLAAMVMGGRTGQVIALNYSYSASFSRDQKQESARIVDQQRVQQETPNPQTGQPEVNPENYIDVDVPKQVAMTNGNGVEEVMKFAPPPTPDNVQVLATNVKQENPEYIPPDTGGGSAAPLRRRINRRAELPR